MDDIVIENHVKLARVERGLTQNELAAAIGVTRQTIGLIEAGKYNPSLKICLLISRTTHKTLDQLFWIKGTDDESLSR